MKAKVYVSLKKGIMDPQGKAVHRSLQSLGFDEVKDVRVGKFLEIILEGKDVEQNSQRVKEMAQKLLANPVIEDFSFELVEE